MISPVCNIPVYRLSFLFDYCSSGSKCKLSHKASVSFLPARGDRSCGSGLLRLQTHRWEQQTQRPSATQDVWCPLLEGRGCWAVQRALLVCPMANWCSSLTWGRKDKVRHTQTLSALVWVQSAADGLCSLLWIPAAGIVWPQQSLFSLCDTGYKAQGSGSVARSRQPALPMPCLPQPLAFRSPTSICPEPSASNKSKASRSCSRCWSLRGNEGLGAAPLPAAASPGAMEGPQDPWGASEGDPRPAPWQPCFSRMGAAWFLRFVLFKALFVPQVYSHKHPNPSPLLSCE